MPNPIPDTSWLENTWKHRALRFVRTLWPSLRFQSECGANKLTIAQSLALGKECHLLLVTIGNQRYLVGRGKSTVDAILCVETSASIAEQSSSGSAQPWHNLPPSEYAKA